MVMQRPAKPRTPVRFRPWPPFDAFALVHESERQKAAIHGRTFHRACPGGEIGRRSGLKIRRTLIGPCRFESGPGHQIEFRRSPAHSTEVH